jgi:hypothetical protein
MPPLMCESVSVHLPVSTLMLAPTGRWRAPAINLDQARLAFWQYRLSGEH